MVTDDVIPLIGHLENAHLMLREIEMMFLGNVEEQRVKLIEEISRITYRKDYFEYLTRFQSKVSQLRGIGGVYSEKSLTMQFLSKLPKSIGHTTHPLKVYVQEQQTDTVSIWNHCYRSVLSYLINTGLYSPKLNKDGEDWDTTKQKDAYKATKNKEGKKNKKNKRRCFNCNEKGHYAKECPKRNKDNSDSSDKKDEDDQNKKKGSWMACNSNSLFESQFILDSGATQHTCGNRRMFSTLRETEKFEKSTPSNMYSP